MGDRGGAGRAGAGITATEAFTRALQTFAGFDGVGDPGRFVPLPEGWTVGVADVVSSTAAIAAGRYRSVNTAGAAVVSAISNALGTLDFPFIFAGDGASFAVAPEDTPRAGHALAATVTWAAAELGLTLRGALLPVSAIRAAGHDVAVARFAASADAAYAMFTGGGLAWAEAELKAGRGVLPPAAPGSRPDLNGLSCGFHDIHSKHGVILSMLVRPLRRSGDPGFSRLLADLLAITESAPDAARPVPLFTKLGGVSLDSVPRRVRVKRSSGASRLRCTLDAIKDVAVAATVFGLRAEIGGFSARRYLREFVANSDFRKYDDRLMMTLDCGTAVADRLAERLARAEREGIAVAGLHRQASAMITCVVPSATRSNHVHFIDGATGGYAMAAGNLKSRLSSMGQV